MLVPFFFSILTQDLGGGEREKHQLVASHIHSDQGSNPQPRYVP